MRVAWARPSAVVFVALSSWSCAQRAASPAASSAAVAEAPPNAAGAIVAAGETLDASLDTPLSTESSRPGDRIRAHTAEPLLAVDGSVVAPTGTLLLGTVTGVERAAAPRLAVRIDGLVVAGRVYPLDAKVRAISAAQIEAPADGARDPLVVELSPAAPAAPGPLAPLDSSSSGRAIGGGPPSDARPLELPRGTRIELDLVAPFELAPERSLEAPLR